MIRTKRNSRLLGEPLEWRRLLDAGGAGEICVCAIEVDAPVRTSAPAYADCDVFSVALSAGEFYGLEFNRDFSLPVDDIIIEDELGSQPIAPGSWHEVNGVFWKAQSSTEHQVTIVNLGSLNRYPEFTLRQEDHGDIASEATAVSVGEYHDARIEVPFDTDWFRFEATEGKYYEVLAIDPRSNGSVQLSLADGAGNVLAEDLDGGTGRLGFVATESGENTIGVSGIADQTVQYRLTVTELDASVSIPTEPGDELLDFGAPSTSLGTTLNGAFESVDSVNRYSFRATTGTHYYRISTTPGSLPDAVIRLLGADGQQLMLSDNSTGAEIYWKPDSAGVYNVEVAGQGVGNYGLTIQARADDHRDDISTNNVPLVTNVAGELNYSGDVDVIALPLEANSKYHFTVTGFDERRRPAIELLSSTGARLSSISSAERSQPTQIDSPDGLTRYLRVTSVGSGSRKYSLSIEEIVDDHSDIASFATSISPNQLINATLENDRDLDYFTLDLPAGGLYRFPRDPALTIDYTNGRTLGSTDDHRYFEARGGGDTLRVAGPTQEYSLLIEPVADDFPPGTSGTIVFGEPNLGRTDAPAERDVFVLPGLAVGDGFQIRSAFHFMEVIAPSGDIVAIHRGTFRLFAEEAGDYTIEVYTSGIGDYEFTVDEAVDVHPDVIPDDVGELVEVVGTVSGRIDYENDRDLFFFDAAAGDRVELEFSGTEIRPSDILVLDEAGTVVTERLGDGFVWTVPEAGRYVLAVEDRRLATYQFSAIIVGDDHSDEPDPSQTAIASGGTFSGMIEVSGDIDVFRLAMEKGDDLLVDRPLSISYQVWSEAEQLLHNWSDRDAFEAPETGSYYLAIQGGPDTTYEGTVSFKDDHPDTLSSGAQEVTSGVPFQGRIDPRLDQDFFRFQATAGQILTNSVQSERGGSLRLYGPDKAPIESFQPWNTTWRIAESGEYFLEVFAGSSILFDYERTIELLDANDDHGGDAASATPVNLPVEIMGQSEAENDVDVFTVTLEAGEVLTIGTEGSRRINVFDANGAELVGRQSASVFRAPAAGDYTVHLQFVDYVGAYTVSLTSTKDDHADVTELATPIELDSVNSAFLDDRSDVDVFVVTVEAGQTYLLRELMHGSAALTVRDDQGRTIVFGATSLLGWEAEYDGQYFISIGDWFDENEISVSLAVDEYPDEVGPDVPILRFGESISGILDSREDSDVIGIDVERGVHYGITGIRGDFTFLDENAEPLSICQWDCSRVEWVSQLDGRIYLQMDGLAAAEYTLSLTRPAEVEDDFTDFIDEDVTLLARNTRVTGRLISRWDRDVFAFDAEASEILNFDISGRLIAFVLDAEGNELEQLRFDFGDEGFDWKAIDSGRYHLALEGQVSSNYGISLSLVAVDDWSDEFVQDAPKLSEDDGRTGVIDAASDRDVFAFDATAGQVATITTAGPRVGLGVADASGNIIQELSGTRVELIVPEDGQYFVFVEGLANSPYELQLQRIEDDHLGIPSPNAVVLEPNSPVLGRLNSPTDNDAFGFAAQQGVAYSFAVERFSLASSSTLTVVDAVGTELGSAFGSSLDWTAPSSGDFYLVISGSRAVDYSVTLLSNGANPLDLTGDGMVDSQDIDTLFAAIRSESQDARYDINGDGLVGAEDRLSLLEQADILEGDWNLDGKVDFNDFLALSQNFQQDGGWTEGDGNGDGKIDFNDFLLLSLNFGS